MFHGSEPVATGADAAAAKAPEELTLYWEIVPSVLFTTYTQSPAGLTASAQGPCPVATVAIAAATVRKNIDVIS
jgi:hypothetical protein